MFEKELQVLTKGIYSLFDAINAYKDMEVLVRGDCLFLLVLPCPLLCQIRVHFGVVNSKEVLCDYLDDQCEHLLGVVSH